MLAPELVDASDQRRDAARPIPVPLLVLVLLGIEIFLAAARHRPVLAQLEAAVNAIGRAQRRRQHQPDLEGRPAPTLQILGQDVRRIDEEIGAQVLAHVGLRELGEILGDLRLGVPPGEVRIRLREPDLRQMAHHLRAGERLGQEDDVRMLPADAGHHPLPEAERLGVRVVDAKDPDTVPDPEEHHPGELVPERRPGRAFEIEWIDVLVLLRRVLRVLDRAVGAMAEPLRVGLHVRVIGRALVGEIERDVQPELPCRGDEPVEVVERSERRVNAHVAAVFRTDGPRAAGIVRAGREGVVRALAVGEADRMNRWQIDDVEPHLRNRGEPQRGLRERRAATGLGLDERGNISYHAPKRARSGSTRTSSGGSRATTASCGVRRRIVSANRSPAAVVTRSAIGSDGSPMRRACFSSQSISADAADGVDSSAWAAVVFRAGRFRLFPAGDRRRAAVAPTISAPSTSSLDTSSAAAVFLARSRCHVPKWSIHAWTRNWDVPTRDTTKLPRHRSFGSGWSADGVQAPGVPVSGSTSRTSSAAAMTSWPSAKMSAVTCTVSPGTRLTG